MIEKISTPETEEVQALEQVEGFVTKVWEHPLLDAFTIEHRQKGIAAMETVLKENNLENGFAVLTGSSIWIAKENSDWDFIVYQKNPDTSAPIIQNNERVNIIDIRVAQESAVFYFDRHFDLLVTPDEYIVGNIKLARQIRLLILNKLILDGELNDGWNGELNQARIDKYFSEKIRGWFFLSSEFAPDKMEERYKRVQNNLDIRSDLAQMPKEKYIAEFNKAMNEISPPKISTYWKALQYTNGELHIDKRKASQNISDLEKNN